LLTFGSGNNAIAMTVDFIPGLELSGLFYQEIIKPILDEHFDSLQYSAALIGAGSEVLGFDTAMSCDHDWGPRLKLFLNERDFSDNAKAIEETLQRYLPNRFRGFPVQWTIDGPAKNHCVELLTIRDFFLQYLNFDIRSKIEPADWLTFPEQKLRSVISGAIYWDAVGLQASREHFRYYPQEIWLYLLAAGWKRIGQEEHLMGRAGVAGDEVGSALIAARLVRDLMRLCFLMEKEYAPYAKWFGTAFAQLESAEELTPLLRQVLLASTWSERQKHLVPAYEIVAARHNALSITEMLNIKTAYFYERPFLVIDGERFANALRAKIVDPAVKRIADRWLIGSIDQFSDSTDLHNDAHALRFLYT
jgi:hypothetical protein